MIISYYYLHYKYTYKHILGALLCTSGVGIIVLCDSTLSSDTNVTTTITATNLFLGDILCLCGSMLYACSNVLQETLVKTNNREEFLGFLGMLLSLIYVLSYFPPNFALFSAYFALILGLFGMMLASIQCYILEYNMIQTVYITKMSFLYMFGFITCLFFMYANTSIFLQDLDSTIFNLSLLTSDVYAVIFSYILYGKLVHWLYFIAFACVVCGLSIYHTQPLPGRDSSSVITHIQVPSDDCCIVEASSHSNNSIEGIQHIYDGKGEHREGHIEGYSININILHLLYNR